MEAIGFIGATLPAICTSRDTLPSFVFTSGTPGSPRRRSCPSLIEALGDSNRARVPRSRRRHPGHRRMELHQRVGQRAVSFATDTGSVMEDRAAPGRILARSRATA